MSIEDFLWKICKSRKGKTVRLKVENPYMIRVLTCGKLAGISDIYEAADLVMQMDNTIAKECWEETR